eukprot:2075422-Pleurochrysis_carterae.AAC.1
MDGCHVGGGHRGTGKAGCNPKQSQRCGCRAAKNGDDNYHHTPHVHGSAADGDLYAHCQLAGHWAARAARRSGSARKLCDRRLIHSLLDR